jgi:hypothetical protein
LSVIKSIQRGVITILGGDAADSATITSVNTAKAFVRLLGVEETAVDGPINFLARVVLDSATSVTAYRGGSPSSILVVSFEVVEFN